MGIHKKNIEKLNKFLEQEKKNEVTKSDKSKVRGTATKAPTTK